MQQIDANPRRHQNRRGIAILWLILWGSLFLTFFCVVLEISTLWQARIELKNSLDAAALAAAEEWGSSGSGETEIARNAGVAYFAANPILGVSTTLGTNYDDSNPGTNPNQNEFCSGNFIFGAITNGTAPYIFDAGESASTAQGTVFMEIVKNNSGTGVSPRYLGIFFDDSNSNPNLCIRQIKFTIPVLGNNLPQQPFFDADVNNQPLVSTAPVPSDALNRFNTDPTVPADPPNTNDFRGLDVDEVTDTPNLTWYCDPSAPPFTLMGMNTNGNGDLCMEMDNYIAHMSGRYRTLIINFSDGAFTSTDDPNTTDFFRFGVSMNQFNEPIVDGGQNDGEAWNLAPVSVEVTFYDTDTMTSSTATTAFVDDGDPDNGRSIATLTFSGGTPAVRAQATVPVQGFCSSMLGFSFLNISARSTAVYDTSTGQAALIHIDDSNYICP